MSGVKVVEMGMWVAGPAAAGILADWGADVVKVESHTGDPLRGLLQSFGASGDVNPLFELDNRGKRSVCLDLRTDEGRQVMDRLLTDADVFVSNMRASALRRFGLDADTLTARHPRLVYAAFSAYGFEGPDANRPGYDVGAFWARGGLAHGLRREGHPPPHQRGGMGDHLAGLAIAAGVSAALFARTQTGAGQVVSTSLLRMAAYTLGWDLNTHVRTGAPSAPSQREDFANPLINSYEAADGKWFWLLGLEADRHWPDVVRAIERPDLFADERFATTDARLRNAAELVSVLDAVFAERPMEAWARVFDREDVWWAPVRSVDELASDPQARAAGVFTPVPTTVGQASMVATPLDFSDTAWEVGGPVPELGQHTEEVLLELGFDHDAIKRLAAQAVIP